MKTITKKSLRGIVLSRGGHKSIEEGACLMEMVAFLRGQPFSDHPVCVSESLGTYGRSLNDLLPDDQRQKLIPLIPKLIDTRNDGKEDRRAWIAVDWLIRVYTPTFLRLVPSLIPYAKSLESLSEISDEATLRLAMQKLTESRDKSSAASAVAMASATAWAAARNASSASATAARDAASAAAWNAAWDASASAAARAAARARAWDAASASAAAWDAATSAAASAVARATATAWAAAWDAARKFLQPTVEKLQASAIELFDRLIEAK